MGAASVVAEGVYGSRQVGPWVALSVNAHRRHPLTVGDGLP